MLDDDLEGGHALGPRGADIILPQHVQHAGARDARDQAHLGDAERDGGQRHGPRPADRILRERDKAARRQPAQRHGEHIDADQSEPEIRYGKADQGKRHDRLVSPAAMFDRSDDAGANPERDGDGEGQQRQRQRHRQPFEDGVGDAAVEQEGLAQITAQEIAIPAEQLDMPGLVKVEAFADAFQLFRRCTGIGQLRGHIARHKPDQHEGAEADHQQNQKGACKALEQKSQHRDPSGLSWFRAHRHEWCARIQARCVRAAHSTQTSHSRGIR